MREVEKLVIYFIFAPKNILYGFKLYQSHFKQTNTDCE